MVGLARQLRKAEDALTGYAEAATCDQGDFMEYAGLRHRLSDTEKNLARSRRADRRQEVIDSLESLRPGDVIEVPGGRFAGMAVVIDPGTRADREGPRPYVLTADRHARRLSLTDFPTPVGSITRVKIPRNFNGRNPQSRARPRLDAAQPHPQPDPAAPGTGSRAAGSGRTPEEDHRIEELRTPAAQPPVPPVPGPGGPRALGRAVLQARRATPRRSSAGSSSAPTRSPGSSTASATC